MLACLWQELRKINQKIARKGDDLDFYSEMVGEMGLEPIWISPFDFKSNAYTNSAIRAWLYYSTINRVLLYHINIHFKLFLSSDRIKAR